MDYGTQHSHLDLGLRKNLVLKRGMCTILIYYIICSIYHREAYYNILQPYSDRETDNRFVSATYIISHAAIV